jgi:hypothetical protein
MGLAKPIHALALAMTVCLLGAAAEARAPEAARTPGAASAVSKLNDVKNRALTRAGQALLRRANRRRLGNARFFREVANGRYGSRHVVYRDQLMTAFLDWTDPASPDYNAKAPLEPKLREIPFERRAHLLVIPNQDYQHVGKRLEGPFSASDVERTEQLMAGAQKLAAELQLTNVSVFENSAQAVSVGYQHIHIIGTKDPARPYPPPLPEPGK